MTSELVNCVRPSSTGIFAFDVAGPIISLNIPLMSFSGDRQTETDLLSDAVCGASFFWGPLS